jgi:hypothetical protein
MCDVVMLADKYGIAGLVILALFSLQLLRARSDEKLQHELNDDIKANTIATIELTARLNADSQNRRLSDK